MNENEKLDIQIEMRSIEIPVSEYRELVGTKAKLDAVINYAAAHDNYDTRNFFKDVFLEDIKKAAVALHIKEDPDE